MPFKGEKKVAADKKRKQLFDKVCAHIADGKSLRQIAKMKGMPTASTVSEWLNKYDGWPEQYARAKEQQADAIFDECLAIADSADPEDAQVARLRIDTRKWMAGKLRPKKYGDRSTVDLNVKGDLVETLQARRNALAQKRAAYEEKANAESDE